MTSATMLDHNVSVTAAGVDRAELVSRLEYLIHGGRAQSADATLFAERLVSTLLERGTPDDEASLEWWRRTFIRTIASRAFARLTRADGDDAVLVPSLILALRELPGADEPFDRPDDSRLADLAQARETDDAELSHGDLDVVRSLRLGSLAAEFHCGDQAMATYGHLVDSAADFLFRSADELDALLAGLPSTAAVWAEAFDLDLGEIRPVSELPPALREHDVDHGMARVMFAGVLDRIVAARIEAPAPLSVAVMRVAIDSPDSEDEPDAEPWMQPVATAVQDVTRATDLGCRFGMREYAVIIADATEHDVGRIVDRIRSRVEAAIDSSDLTVSIGVGFLEEVRASWQTDEVLAAAESALGRAFRRGGSCTRVHRAKQGFDF